MPLVKKKKIQVTNEEINNELRKQMGMMPGQEKIVQDYYQKNPAALDSLRGSIYEEKIIDEIKKNGKSTIKEITKEEAEKILKDENEKSLKDQAKYSPHSHENDKEKQPNDAKSSKAATLKLKKTASSKKKPSTVNKKKNLQKKLAKSNHKLYK